MSRKRVDKFMKVRVAIAVPSPATPEQLEKARAFIIAAKKRIEQRQNVQIVIVDLYDAPSVIYNPITKESYYVL